MCMPCPIHEQPVLQLKEHHVLFAPQFPLCFDRGLMVFDSQPLVSFELY